MMIKRFLAAWAYSALLTNVLFFFICRVWFKWVYFVPPIEAYRSWILETKWGGWLILMGLMNFVIIALLVGGYHFAYRHIPYAGIKKGVIFGVFVWFSGGLFYLLHVFITFKVSFALFSFWMLIGLLNCVLVGVVASVVYK